VQCGQKTSANENLLASNAKEPQNRLALTDDPLNRDVEELLNVFRSMYEKEDATDTELTTDLRKPKYVKFKDVKKWRAAGEEHAAGYDASGKLLAIYDLSYQSTLSGEFIGRSILGTIGVGDINLRELIRILTKALRQKQSDIEFSGDGQSGPMTKDNLKKAAKVLQKIDETYGDLKSPLTGEWWKQIPIKKDIKGNLLTDPQVSFKLSDIDFDSFMSTTQRWSFHRKLKKVQKDIGEIFDIDASHLLDQLSFQRNAQGHYDLRLLPVSSLAPNEQPDKVVDLVRYQSSFGYALLYLVIKEGLMNVSSAIPQPVVAAIVRYAVVRWFELYEEQISFHRFRAFEYVNAAEREEPSPFAFMSPQERAKAGVYILSHESSIFHTIFKKRDEAYFYDSIKTELMTVRKNTEWTTARNLTLTSISSLFYYGDDAKTPDMDYMLSMGGHPRFPKQPFIAVNYNKPQAERLKRNLLKSLYDILQAVPMPFPGMSALLSMIYDILIMDDIRDAMRWEARLVSTLNMSKTKDYSKEIELIYSQRVNPFEFDHDEEKVFVQRSKAYLGL
jgi:hypothetical protein